MSLSVLCVTKLEPHAARFLYIMQDLASALDAQFVVAVDGDVGEQRPACDVLVPVKSAGFLESVLEIGINACSGDYVLRLDDDEMASQAMFDWLVQRAYEAEDHWKFSRVHLWGDDESVLMTPHLFPDHQTRLSIKAKSGGRHSVHAGSPFGGGVEAPVYLEHHKFLVRSCEDRLRIAKTYDQQAPGYGTGMMKPFSLPEWAYGTALLVEKGQGTVPWTPAWQREISLGASA